MSGSPARARAAAALSHPAIATVYALEEIDGDLLSRVNWCAAPRYGRAGGGALFPQRAARHPHRRSPKRSTPRTGRASSTAISSPRTCCVTGDGRVKSWTSGSRASARRPTRRAGAHAHRHRASARRATWRPNSCADSQVDARADVFAFGVIAYELATGLASLRRQRSGGAARAAGRPTLRRCREPIDPPALDAIVRRCLRGDRDGRFASGVELLQALRRLHTGTAPRRARRSSPRRRGGGSSTRSPSPC